MGSKIPPGLYSAEHDGTGDPDRLTIAQRQRRSVEQHAEEAARRRSMSPLVRAMQAATDRALGGGR